MTSDERSRTLRMSDCDPAHRVPSGEEQWRIRDKSFAWPTPGSLAAAVSPEGKCLKTRTAVGYAP